MDGCGALEKLSGTHLRHFASARKQWFAIECINCMHTIHVNERISTEKAANMCKRTFLFNGWLVWWWWNSNTLRGLSCNEWLMVIHWASNDSPRSAQYLNHCFESMKGKRRIKHKLIRFYFTAKLYKSAAYHNAFVLRNRSNAKRSILIYGLHFKLCSKNPWKRFCEPLAQLIPLRANGKAKAKEKMAQFSIFPWDWCARNLLCARRKCNFYTWYAHMIDFIMHTIIASGLLYAFALCKCARVNDL